MITQPIPTWSPVLQAKDTELKAGQLSRAEASDLFRTDRRKLMELILPPLTFPVDLAYSNGVTQFFCHSENGLLEVFDNKHYATYNGDMPQGYTHTAIDINGSYLHFDEGNWIINPFPEGCKVEVYSISNITPDRVSSEDYASKGNVVRLRCFLDGDEKNPTPLSSFFVEFCHVKQDSCLLKRGDFVGAGQKICQIGYSGFSSLAGIHTHVVFNYTGRWLDPFEGQNNSMIYKSLWHDQDFILNQLSIKKASPTYFPDNYEPVKDAYRYQSWFSVDGVDKQRAVKLERIEEQETHAYKFYMAGKEINNIWIKSSPYGETKVEYADIEETEGKGWWKDKPLTLDLIEHAKSQGHEIKTGMDKVYLDDTDGRTKMIPIYWVELQYTSDETQDKGLGMYQYQCADKDGKLGSKLHLILVEKKY